MGTTSRATCPRPLDEFPAMPVCPACGHAIAATPICPHCGVAAPDSASSSDFAPETGPGPVGEGTRGRRPRLSQEEAWTATIGPRRTGRYLRRFTELSRPGASRLGWHWPAFFAPPLWFLYRKMWGWAALWGLGLPLLWLGVVLLGSTTGALLLVLDGFSLLSLVGAAFVLPALFADRLYLAHCNRLIDRVHRRKSPRHRIVARLSSGGGTSETAATVAGVFAGFAVLGVVGGLVLAVWVEYGKREKFVEALRFGAGARAAVAAFVDRRGTIPLSLQDAGFVLKALPAHITRVGLDPRTGTIEIDTQVSKAEAGAIRLVPQIDRRERIVWVCEADPAIAPFGPRSCRDE